jgi:glycosyltransferase involved in cell wall biosynthesis
LGQLGSGIGKDIEKNQAGNSLSKRMREPITVLFVETSMRIGGTENVITQLVERFDRSRIRPLICCFYERGILGDRLAKEGVTVYHRLAKNRWDIGIAFRLLRLLRRERVDVLFLINQPLIQFWGTWCGLLAKVPVIITAIRSTGKVNRIHRRFLINQLTFRWITRVTALSQMHKDYLVKQEGIDARKIEIVRNGVDLERFKMGDASSSLRRLFRIDDDARVVGIVAMLRPEKAHGTFLKAAAYALREVPKARFLVVGEGQERPRLEGLAKDLGIERAVYFLGARGDIPSVLSLLDVAVLSSNPVVETLPNAVLEYMAAGKPTVATRVGSLSEMIDEGKTGYLVEPGDWKEMGERIVQLLENRDLARTMGRAGRLKVEREYAMEQMIRNTEALFERLLNHREAL